MTNAQAQQPPIVRWRRRAVIFLLVVGAAFVARAVADVWTGRALTAEIARLEDRFGPLRWDSVRKVHPYKTWPRRMAPNNRARLMDAAAARITVTTDADVDLLYAANSSRWEQVLTSDRARAIAEVNREAVDLAIRAARVPHSNWTGRDLTDVRFLSTLLAITARSDIDSGRADAAAEAVTAGLAIATAMGSEPRDIMLLLATRMAWVYQPLVEDLLNRGEPSAAALAEMARVLEESLAAPPARPALLGHLKSARDQWPRVERGLLFSPVDADVYPWPSEWMRAVAWLARPIIRYRALRDLAEKGRAVDVASMPRAERAALTSPLGPPAPGLIDVGDQWTVIMVNATTAVALRRFRIDRGTYPARLDELVPGYLKVVPIDPYAGGPPEYLRSGSGFELRTSAPRQEYLNWNVVR